MPDEIHHIDLSKMTTMEQMRSIVKLLMNTVESLSSEVAALKKENQELKDTINRLKGEQGKPKFPGTNKKPDKDTSSKGKEKGNATGKPRDKNGDHPAADGYVLPENGYVLFIHLYASVM